MTEDAGIGELGRLSAENDKALGLSAISGAARARIVCRSASYTSIGDN